MSTPNSSTTLKPTSQPSKQPVKLTVNGSDRWFFTGRTGMGKSHLMKHLARMYAAKGGRVVIVDGPDHSWLGKDKAGKLIEPARRGDGTIDKPRLVKAFNRKCHVQLFRPRVPGYSDQALMNYLEAAFKEERLLIIFDELFGILDPNHQPEIVMQLWSQGRKHDIAVWAASQRPARIPEIVMSQAENWAIFNIINKNDRKKIAEWIGSPQIVEEVLPPRYWWYFGTGMNSAKLMKPIGDT